MQTSQSKDDDDVVRLKRRCGETLRRGVICHWQWQHAICKLSPYYRFRYLKNRRMERIAHELGYDRPAGRCACKNCATNVFPKPRQK